MQAARQLVVMFLTKQHLLLRQYLFRFVLPIRHLAMALSPPPNNSQLTWPAAATATSYDVYIWTGATAPASTTANVATASYNATRFNCFKLQLVYSAPRNAGGAATACGATNTTCIYDCCSYPAPSCATNTAPANGTTIATQTTATLAWNAVSNATSYDVYIWSGATPPAFTTANVATNLTVLPA